MATTANSEATAELVAGLSDPNAYRYDQAAEVVVHETHISWVFLVDEFAFKVKKPVKTGFLDYTTLERRRRFCHEEMRLDARYAEDLYLGVVPITRVDGHYRVEGDGKPIEYAVKMRRFSDDALLSSRLESGAFTTHDLFALAHTVAAFHQSAAQADLDTEFGTARNVYRDAWDNLSDLEPRLTGDSLATLHVLAEWTRKYFADHQDEFDERRRNGFIRECHGDLHLDNVVYWKDRLIPFDGIEFNEQFRWIDVLSDAAFLAMDFAAHDRHDLSRSFINAYLERTGDHTSLALLRWYLTYRALVRAKVASIRAAQPGLSDTDQQAADDDCAGLIDLAYRFTRPQRLCLWITHGVSGSGKTTHSERIVQRHGAIRLRSDIERKRRFGISLDERPDRKTKAELYSESAGEATYEMLKQRARGILRSGYPVIVDATFLRKAQRQSFHELADSEGVRFAILDCHAEHHVLRQRVAERTAKQNDASDADLQVLEMQLASQEPLTVGELKYKYRDDD